MQQFPSNDEKDAEAQLRARHRGARLLLAEDNPIHREVALELLHAVGLAVDIAEDGQAAVEKALRRRYDLILLDLRMPGMDGMAAARSIRAGTDRGRVPILAMTTGAPGEDRDACLAAGMSEPIAKPVDPPALYAALLRHLDGSRAGNPEGGPAPAADPGQALYACVERIPGLDVAQGLKFAANKWALYAKLLGMFVHDDEAAIERLRGHLAAGDIQAAVRIAHSLKSIGATLGAGVLSRRAALAEQALRAGPGHAGEIEPLCAEVETELARLCAAIRTCLGPSP